MKKGFLILIAILFIVIYAISSSNQWMHKIAFYRYYKASIFPSERYKYGDLFGLCYLSTFKHKLDFTKSDVKINPDTTNRNINLYIVGDSYLGTNYLPNRLALNNVNSLWYKQVNVDNPIKHIVSIDTTQQNILLIETVEHGLISFLDTNYIYNRFDVNAPKPENVKPAEIKKETVPPKYKMTLGRRFLLMRQFSFVNPILNENIEFNLFDYYLFTFFKELKADLNYYLFHRISEYVTVSPDNKYLLFKPTVDSTSLGSSFKYIRNTMVDSIVNTINKNAAYYKKKGFKKVYFSIIPKPVSILYPNLGKYNNLVCRVQNHPELKVTTIKVYNIFKETKIPIYLDSDTHWNNNGANIWINEFNKVLESSLYN